MVFSATYSLLFKDTSSATNRRVFIETSPVNMVFSDTYSLLFKDTSSATNRRVFIETSPSIIAFSATYNLLFNDTSSATKRRVFIETSPVKMVFSATYSLLFNDTSFATNSLVFIETSLSKITFLDTYISPETSNEYSGDELSKRPIDTLFSYSRIDTPFLSLAEISRTFLFLSNDILPTIVVVLSVKCRVSEEMTIEVTFKFRKRLVVVPKSYVLSASGTICVLTTTLSLTNNLSFIDTSPLTSKLLSIVVSPETYNWLLRETSSDTKRRLFIEISPELVILICSVASEELLLPALAVKNISSLFVESALGCDAMTFVFCATLITPPNDPHESPGP